MSPTLFSSLVFAALQLDCPCNIESSSLTIDVIAWKSQWHRRNRYVMHVPSVGPVSFRWAGSRPDSAPPSPLVPRRVPLSEFLAPTLTARISLDLPCFPDTMCHAHAPQGALPWACPGWPARDKGQLNFSSRALISLRPGFSSNHHQHFLADLSSITSSRDYHQQPATSTLTSSRPIQCLPPA